MKDAKLQILSIFLLMLGCKSEEKPVPLEPGVVPLKVWVVRAPSDSAVEPAIRQNKGCRLTTDEIRDRIHHVQNKATTVYGANIKFQWMPEEPTLLIQQFLDQLPSGIRTMTPTQHYNFTILQDGPDNWTFGSINIYFVGDIQENVVPYPATIALAWTFDPKQLSDANITPNRGHMILNDCGFDSTSGFPDRAVFPGGPVIPFDPAAVTSYNVIEHEMTH